MTQRLVVTRHMPQEMRQYAKWEPYTRKKAVPIGADLDPPYEGARVLFVDHSSGWFYVYWIGEVPE